MASAPATDARRLPTGEGAGRRGPGRLRRALAWALALALLLAVFALYAQPTVLVTLSEQLWACFN